jgi:hypothetical protein
MVLMGLGHTGGVLGVSAPHDAADMGGHPLPAMEQLDRGRGHAGIDEFVGKDVGTE